MTINVFSDLGMEQTAVPTGATTLTRNFIGFFVYRTSNVAVASGDQVITYQASIVDTNGFFSSLPGTTATIPVGLGGRYAFGTNIVGQETGSSADYLSYIVRNGTETLCVGQWENCGNQALQLNAHGFGILNAGDTILSRVILVGATGQTHFGSSAATPKGFWLAYLGT